MIRALVELRLAPAGAFAAGLTVGAGGSALAAVALVALEAHGRIDAERPTASLSLRTDALAALARTGAVAAGCRLVAGLPGKDAVRRADQIVQEDVPGRAGACPIYADRVRFPAAVEVALAGAARGAANERGDLDADALLAGELGTAALARPAAAAIADAGGGRAGTGAVGRVEPGWAVADAVEAGEAVAAVVGDRTGRRGLQARLERRLAATEGIEGAAGARAETLDACVPSAAEIVLGAGAEWRQTGRRGSAPAIVIERIAWAVADAADAGVAITARVEFGADHARGQA